MSVLSLSSQKALSALRQSRADFFWRRRGTERFAGRETRQPPPRVTHEPKYKFRERQVTAVVIIWRYIRRRGPTDDALRLPRSGRGRSDGTEAGQGYRRAGRGRGEGQHRQCHEGGNEEESVLKCFDC